MSDNWNDLLESLVSEDDSKKRKKLAKKLRKWIESNVDIQAEETQTENGHQENEELTKSNQRSNGKATDENESETPAKSSKNKEKSEKFKEEVPEKKKKRTKSEDEATPSASPAPVKKQKLEEEEVIEENSNGYDDQSKSTEKKRFQRVDEEKALQKAIVADNRYEAVFGSGGYGAKANEKLKTVRGKDFRHEKTKKKRGSYRGGAIDEGAVRSVDFDSD